MTQATGINIYASEMIRVFGPKVYYALHDSKLRGDVLIFFKNNPFYLTINIISKTMHIDYSNIRGVVCGDGGNYSKDKGLARLGLLASKKTRGEKAYIINQKGLKAAKLLEKERESTCPTRKNG